MLYLSLRPVLSSPELSNENECSRRLACIYPLLPLSSERQERSDGLASKHRLRTGHLTSSSLVPATPSLLLACSRVLASGWKPCTAGPVAAGDRGLGSRPSCTAAAAGRIRPVDEPVAASAAGCKLASAAWRYDCCMDTSGRVWLGSLFAMLALPSRILPVLLPQVVTLLFFWLGGCHGRAGLLETHSHARLCLRAHPFWRSRATG